MPKMDINFRNVLSTKQHGCLKHIKMQLVEKREQWELVLTNVKHVLRSVLKALDYMHSQGLVHRDIKASNILIKKTCQCTEVLYCSCQRGKFLVQIGDFDSSATVPGYQLQIEEHQMIRYASILPLGTMGYRAPEVSYYWCIVNIVYEFLFFYRFQCILCYQGHMKCSILPVWISGHLDVCYLRFSLANLDLSNNVEYVIPF